MAAKEPFFQKRRFPWYHHTFASSIVKCLKMGASSVMYKPMVMVFLISKIMWHFYWIFNNPTIETMSEYPMEGMVTIKF
jgi:hypothetical protein